MKASEARKDWKNVLDRAAQGEVIQIERGGVIYWLKAMVNVLPPGGKWLETDEVSSNIRPATAPPANPFIDEVGYVSKKDLENLKIGKGVEVSSTPAGKKNKLVGFANESKLQEFQKEKKMKFCANGHAIPEGRSKCMGKGCKYAK